MRRNIIDEDRIKIIREIRELQVKKYSLRKIAVIINENPAYKLKGYKVHREDIRKLSMEGREYSKEIVKNEEEIRKEVIDGYVDARKISRTNLLRIDTLLQEAESAVKPDIKLQADLIKLKDEAARKYVEMDYIISAIEGENEKYISVMDEKNRQSIDDILIADNVKALSAEEIKRRIFLAFSNNGREYLEKRKKLIGSLKSSVKILSDKEVKIE